MKVRQNIYYIFVLCIVGCGSDISLDLINSSNEEIIVSSLKLDGVDLNAKKVTVPISKKTERRNIIYGAVPKFEVHGGEKLTLSLVKNNSEENASCDLGEKPDNSWSVLYVNYNGTGDLVCTYDWGQ
ncbi:MAG: hypothetical protein IPK30_04910 [Cellvibrionales bacterium]|jgi:hypothetical protein|nr:hypothetical protein [Cellvibrionales bacterium]